MPFAMPIKTMRDLTNIPNPVQVICYTKRVGVAYTVRASRYPRSMILEANMPEEEIDEAITHLSAGIRIAIDSNRKQALMTLVDALLDAKLEKKQ